MIAFDRSICGNLADAKRREWLETNGIGGYASLGRRPPPARRRVQQGSSAEIPKG